MEIFDTYIMTSDFAENIEKDTKAGTVKGVVPAKSRTSTASKLKAVVCTNPFQLSQSLIMVIFYPERI